MSKAMIWIFLASGFVFVISGLYLAYSMKISWQALGVIVGFLAVITSIWLTGLQIANNIKLAREQQRIARLNDIHNQSSHLKALQMELEHNYNGYLQYVSPMRESMLSGKTTHHFFEYRTSELQPNLSNFTLAYNTLLLNKVTAIYDMCDEANRIFQYVRSGEADRSKIKDYWIYLFDKHDKLLGEWKKAINEVGEASNYYEPISLMLDKNAANIGAQVGAAIDNTGRAISIFNFGGIGAENIQLVAKFEKHPEQEYVRDLPYLRRQTSANFGLFIPRYPEQDITGKVHLQYYTAASKDIHTSSFDVKWDGSTQKWVQEGGFETLPKGFASFVVGNIFEGYSDFKQPTRETPKVEMVLDESGHSLRILNTGKVVISKVLLQNVFGQLDGWKDFESQKYILPGESIDIELPAQADDKQGTFSGYIYFQAEGQDDVKYQVFSYEWKPNEKRWSNQWAR